MNYNVVDDERLVLIKIFEKGDKHNWHKSYSFNFYKMHYHINEQKEKNRKTEHICLSKYYPSL